MYPVVYEHFARFRLLTRVDTLLSFFFSSHSLSLCPSVRLSVCLSASLSFCCLSLSLPTEKCESQQHRSLARGRGAESVAVRKVLATFSYFLRSVCFHRDSTYLVESPLCFIRVYIYLFVPSYLRSYLSAMRVCRNINRVVLDSTILTNPVRLTKIVELMQVREKLHIFTLTHAHTHTYARISTYSLGGTRKLALKLTARVYTHIHSVTRKTSFYVLTSLPTRTQMLMILTKKSDTTSLIHNYQESMNQMLESTARTKQTHPHVIVYSPFLSHSDARCTLPNSSCFVVTVNSMRATTPLCRSFF